ncbi:IclR family transcriptional regulator [Halobaculum magnesiiphilum]|uniref:IclR family transcriptional regulator n=1 Tax=Halobaculum magnesiiphilum TaxID=1017351 RepID=A0A8T8WEM4_9EURY|nr:IclR family transcriptional regulator [Halobaculum magnesiiphilum]QZP38307.1 IclR family transcriptional regulator [Halobaculum magnesiiphilum]
MTGRGSQRVQATVHSVRILERLVEAGRPMGVTELADAVDLSKGVVHTHLNTLVDLGYVRKEEQSYLPSFGLVGLGDGARRQLPQFDRVRRRVDNLARVTGEVATLFVEEDGVGVCVYVAPSSDAWTPEYTSGSRIPLHVTAPGKAILSTFDGARVDEIVDDRGLDRMTDKTVTERADLAAQLGSIRENGVVFCRGEQSADTIGVAAPITPLERAPAAAVGICGPGERLRGRQLEEDIAGQVISTARTIRTDLRG